MVSSRVCLHVVSLTLLSVNLLTTDAFSTAVDNQFSNRNVFTISQISNTAIAPTAPRRISSTSNPHHHHQNHRSTTILSMNGKNDEGPSSRTTIKPNNKLLAESIAPWRTLRIFFYVSLGSGALLGGFINLTGLAANLSGAGPPGLDINMQYKDVAIDFVAVALFAIATKLDFDKGQELDEQVEAKIQKTKQSKGLKKGMKEREAALGSLEIDLRVDEGGNMQKAMVSAVQSGAKQHMIIVAGSRKVIRDALLGANLLKMEFALRDVLVVPYELGGKSKDKVEENKMSKPDGTGFAADKRPMWETQPYVADTVGDGWEEYINAEMEDAVKQNGERVRQEGIAIIVANTGEIIRRGVGQVPWRNIVEELEQKGSDEGPVGLPFLGGN